MSSCTVVIPSRDRPKLLAEAVDSALAQTAPDTRVLVVDDGSRDPVRLADHPALTVVRHLRPRGVSAARNLGISLASTPWVTFLDDDDRMRPHLIARSFEVAEAAQAPGPVAVLSAVAVLDQRGRVVETRRPPPLRERGRHFSLEPLEPGRSYFSKQTLVVPRETLLEVDGFDERFRSRVVTELFWRLNPVCSIVGLDEVTYELRAHPGPRISGDPRRRQRSFRQLVNTHRDLLVAHPEGYAQLLAQHARTSLAARQPVAAARAVLAHARVAPGRTRWAVRDALRQRGS